MAVITIERKVLEKNDAFAAENRRRLAAARVFTINVVSSPGAGKTSLLEQTIEQNSDKVVVKRHVVSKTTDIKPNAARFG